MPKRHLDFVKKAAVYGLGVPYQRCHAPDYRVAANTTAPDIRPVGQPARRLCAKLGLASTRTAPYTLLYDGHTSFEKLLAQHVANRNDERFIHPGALLDLFEPDYHRHSVIYGMQGAGNLIFANIIRKLCSSDIRHAGLRHAHVLHRMQWEYFTAVKRFFTAWARTQGGKLAGLAIDTPEQFIVTLAHPVYGRLYIRDVCSNTLLFGTTQNYHTLPDEPTLHKLRKTTKFYIQRNPLDQFLSFYKKKAQAKASELDEIMEDRTSFPQFVKGAVETLRQWNAIAPSCITLRYEHLMENPYQTISDVAGHLGIAVSHSHARRIWDSIGMQQLPDAPPGHFQGGGTNRWHNVFKDWHIAVLMHYGMKQLLIESGYHHSVPALMQAAQSAAQPAASLTFNEPAPLLSRAVGRLRLESFNEEFLTLIENALENDPVALALLHAGGLRKDRLIAAAE